MRTAAGQGGRERRRGRSAALGASALAHAAVLAALGWAVTPLRWKAPATPPEPVIELRLRADGASEQPAPAPYAPAAPRLEPETPHTGAAARLAPAPALATTPAATPARPTPAGPAPPGVSTSAAASGVSGAPGLGAAEQGALRGLLGCAHAGALELTGAEKARCAERLGLASRTAPRVDPIPAEKRAYYDAVAAAYADAHFYATPQPPSNRAAFEGRRTAVHQWREGVPPGHTFNAGCSPLFLLPGYKPPPHSLRLGPCLITPPRGSLTEEADIAEPPSLRERTDDAAHMRALDPPPAPPPPR